MRFSRIVAVLAVSVLALSACSSSDGTSGTDTDATADSETSTATASGSQVEVTGEFGEVPEITVPEASAPEEMTVDYLQTGEGAEIAAGDYVYVNYHGVKWEDGEVFDSSFERGTPFSTVIGQGMVIKAWDEGLIGVPEGSRVIITAPPAAAYGGTGSELEENTLVFVTDVIKVSQTGVSGQADAKEIDGALDDTAYTISGDLGAEAQISVAEGAEEPTEANIYVLSEGTGPEIAKGYVEIQYALTTIDGQHTESSWQEQGFPVMIEISELTDDAFPLDQALSLLEGIPAGSRVVLEAPTEADSPAFALVVDIISQVEM